MYVRSPELLLLRLLILSFEYRIYIYIYIYMCVSVCVCVCVFTNPFTRAGCDRRSIFNRSLTDLNLEFSFHLTCCYTEIKELNLLHNLPIAGWRIVGCISFPWILALCKIPCLRFELRLSLTITPRILSLSLSLSLYLSPFINTKHFS